MFTKLASTTAIAAAFLALSASGAASQQSENGSDQMADACLTDMNAFAGRMNEDEFWLSGWGTGVYGTPPAAQSTQAPATTADGATTTPEPGADPRGERVGIEAPRYQIRTLYSTARVLAHRGDADGCEYVVAKMNEVYDDYAQQLQEAGVDPESVTTWRQEQLALAEPLSGEESMSTYRVDNITGTDVRNMDDENLGSVGDVIIDPQSGSAAYVIVARGGFLGMGDDYYAIPWDEVRGTPGLGTIVVDRTEAEIEQAPSVDPNRFRDPATMVEERRSTDDFWSERQP